MFSYGDRFCSPINEVKQHYILRVSCQCKRPEKVFISSAVDVVSGIILNAETDLSKRDMLEHEDAVGYTAKSGIRANGSHVTNPGSYIEVSPS